MQKQGVKLDLHGLRHIDARNAVIRFIEDHWNSNREVQIVTGNSAKMREIVLAVLDEYKLDYQTFLNGRITLTLE